MKISEMFVSVLFSAMWVSLDFIVGMMIGLVVLTQQPESTAIIFSLFLAVGIWLFVKELFYHMFDENFSDTSFSMNALYVAIGMCMVVAGESLPMLGILIAFKTLVTVGVVVLKDNLLVETS